LIASADPAALRAKPWAKLVFKPMQFPYQEGIWRGPLIVLVDGGTASAAEQFTAVLQDHQAAVILGAPTLGAGCGHTNGGTPTTLRHSRGVLEMPDCVRFRADGSNEVMGIQPDILIGLRRLDGPRRGGLRFAAKLPEALERASTIASFQGRSR
jgi:C-terminal processing protease CtpA/Prc